MHGKWNTKKNVINVIVKDLVLEQDTGMSMNVFLIRVRNFYPEHFDLMKKYNWLYK
jgi:hypothetical protein